MARLLVRLNPIARQRIERRSCISASALMFWSDKIEIVAAVILLLGACPTMSALAAPPTHIMVTRGDARLEVLAQGKGPTIVLLPSLGRGATDFDPIAEHLADAGFRVLRPQPRGIGQSTGPWHGVKLEELAADIAAVTEHYNNG